MKKRLVQLLVLILAATSAKSQLYDPSFAAPAPATPTLHAKRPATIEALRVGFSGILPGDDWAPLRVYISGNPNVNNGAFGGFLVLTFAQDATQSAEISCPVATTPGRVTPVEIIAAVPRAAAEFRISLRDSAGNTVDEQSFSRRGTRGQTLPGAVTSSPLVLALIDQPGSSPEITRSLPGPELLQPFGPPANPDNNDKGLLAKVIRVVALAQDFPHQQHGYDGLQAVILGSNQFDSLSRQQLESIAEWTLAGGRLVVLIAPGAQSWPQLFGPFAPPLDFADISTEPPGGELAKVLSKAPEGDLGIPGRRLTVLDSSTGWKARWTDGQNPMRGLLAEGPVGLGWITAVGVIPDRISPSGAKELWQSALQSPLALLGEAHANNDNGYSSFYRGSGSNPASRAALRSIIDHLSDIPPIGDGTFAVVIVAMLLLAAAVGPFDAIFLGARGRRSRSWATALSWIAIASLIAGFLPPMLRSGESVFQRARAVDVLPGPDPICHESSLNSIFASSYSDVRLVSAGRSPAETITGGWFRGVSPSFLSEMSEAFPLTIFQTVQNEVRDAASGQPGRANRPLFPFTMGQWTFRTFADELTSAATAPAVSIDKSGAGYRVRIAGREKQIASGSLRVGDQWFNLVPEGTGGQDMVFSTVPGSSDDWMPPDDHATNDFQVRPYQPGLAFQLVAPRRRTLAIERYLQTGRYVCLYLLEQKAKPTLLALAGGQPMETRESAVWRIVLPLGPTPDPRPTP